MTRPSRDDSLMMVAYTMQERSTCTRNHVGAVISINGRIISTGYNGAPAGMNHCQHPKAPIYHSANRISPVPPLDEGVTVAQVGCKVAVHAEANAIAFAARYGLVTEGAELHTTLSPCYSCAQLIINAGLVRVVFHRSYRDLSGMDLLHQAKVVVEGSITQ